MNAPHNGEAENFPDLGDGQAGIGYAYDDLKPEIITLPLQEGAPDSWRQRVGNLLKAARGDIANSDHRFRTVASGLGVLGVQAVGATKAPVIMVPLTTFGVLKRGGNALEAGGLTGAMFGTWCFIATRILNRGVNHYPGTVKAASDNFPDLVRHFSNSLAGLQEVDQKENFDKRTSLVVSIGKKAVTHAHRGMTAIGIGITPYLVAAGIGGQSKAERVKLCNALSLDSATVIGLTSTATAAAIIKIGDTNPKLAERIQDDYSNAKVWLGVAGLMMAGEWLKNKRKEIKASRSLKEG